MRKNQQDDSYDETGDAGAVDGDVSEVGEQLLSTVELLDKVEETGGIIDKGGPALALNKSVVGHKTLHKGNVGLDTTDAELDQSTNNLPSGKLICSTRASNLDQQGVVVRSNDSADKSLTSVQTNTVSTSRSINLNSTCVWLEALSGVLCGDTALDSKAANLDLVLGQSELGQEDSSSNLNLSSNNVDTSDLLYSYQKKKDWSAKGTFSPHFP